MTAPKHPKEIKQAPKGASVVVASVDWERIELEYRAGVLSLREIAELHPGTNHVSIARRAKREGWTRDLKINAGRSVKLERQDIRTRSGFVYAIYFDDSAGERFYKIGLSSVFNDRLGSHSTSNPFDLYVACAYFTGDMRSEERYLHTRFNEQRIRGEWFKLRSSDLLEISARSLLV